jgi:hypothetical protein
MQEALAYEIKGRTMSLEEWDLRIQIENPVDFISLRIMGVTSEVTMKLKV